MAAVGAWRKTWADFEEERQQMLGSICRIDPRTGFVMLVSLRIIPYKVKCPFMVVLVASGQQQRRYRTRYASRASLLEKLYGNLCRYSTCVCHSLVAASLSPPLWGLPFPSTCDSKPPPHLTSEIDSVSPQFLYLYNVLRYFVVSLKIQKAPSFTNMLRR